MFTCPSNRQAQREPWPGRADETRKATMKKILLATRLALGVVGVGQSQARAGSNCWNLSGCYHIKVCTACNLRAWCEAFKGCCGGCGGGGGYGGYGGYGGGCDACGSPHPGGGPWYAYWPSAGGPMVAGSGY